MAVPAQAAFSGAALIFGLLGGQRFCLVLIWGYFRNRRFWRLLGGLFGFGAYFWRPGKIGLRRLLRGLFVGAY